MIKIAPSILSADFAALAEEIARVEAGGADQIHVDVMDGHFVPNITIGIPVVESIRKRTRLPLDLHLMITNPDAYLEAFVKAGGDSLTVHVEVCPHLHRTLGRIRELGARPGVALNPATPPAALDYAFDEADLVLVMSVNPGFGGQRFIPTTYAKLRDLVGRLGDRPLEVAIDGGVKLEHCRPLVAHGATTLVVGSAVFEAADPAVEVRRLREAALAP
ncbi:MAG: ribulose-phosphate 3-epimerase [Candidatus Rokubacteria bacterium]|nr:ribulose-phosphate 3-epimerase [Candidatus Rokubacteria bacterium]